VSASVLFSWVFLCAALVLVARSVVCAEHEFRKSPEPMRVIEIDDEDLADSG
jgi:hypothetical protein